ncbi:hypothetical protein [Spirilliplanes yamanashiensis]|uniref:Uncharacterized protein n=1 Tax=Spirilliplanes yamanashiensis TaxID=42233 RepID=A0A8J4DMM5_9ACTN|nr:hypothetical protein [Spirilliplanes yamanashiensis]MDP9818513.1 ornithine cyclodeaminase/alanine dehydrogenase-like protein (mu-crystallin family) [Spirilliplanes yamanashiensis]GIJ06359.1 hypothetical protein Sya03_57110 [Spirilliplanes yamanashiensis]
MQLSEAHRQELTAVISTFGQSQVEPGEYVLRLGADSPEQREAVRQLLDAAADRAGYALG